MNDEQDNKQSQLSNMAKNQGKKAIANTVKNGLKAGLKWFFKFVILPILPYILGAIAILLLVFVGWELLFNSKGKTQDYQTEDAQEYNTVEKNDETGDVEAVDLSFGNKIVQAFYTYYSEKSIYITCEDKGVDEPIQWNSPDFIQKFGENGETEGFRDKYEREQMFYINPKALWTFDEYLNNGDFKFPEQFIKPVYNGGIDEDFALKHLTDDETGALIAESVKYEESDDSDYKIPVEGETELGVWDYGFGSILNYQEYDEEAKQVGTYEKIQVWDIEEQELVSVTLQEAQEGSESGKYEGFKDYSSEVYEEEIPSANLTSYMIDRVTTPAGTITNTIEQRWIDSQEPFHVSITRTEEVTVRYEDDEIEKISLEPNEQATVYTYVDLDGNESKPVTVKNEEDVEKKIEYTVTYEKEKKEMKEMTASVRGTIHRFTPIYIGSPDTSNITGSRYYKDYIKNYESYVPDSVLTSFDFDDIRERTGEDNEELLELLEREPFGATSEGGDVTLEFGNGAMGDAHQRALQHLASFEKYGNMYGIDPYLMIQIAVGESGGNHEGTLGGCATKGCGIMQIEVPGTIIKTASAYNHETGVTDVFQVTSTNAKDVDTNIKIGTMLMANRIKNNDYNILMGLQSYNFGASFENHVLPAYAESSGKTEDEIRADMSDIGWLEYVMDFHINPNNYLNGTWQSGATVCQIPECDEHGVSGNHYGNPAYVERFLKEYASPNPEGMWVMKEDGSKVILSTDGNFSMTEGSGHGVIFNWLVGIWDFITDNWQHLFPGLPDELSDERTKYSNKVNENEIDTIIKMMFVMEEGKYLTEYEDFTEEDWIENYKILFSNPIGTSWGSGVTPTVDINQYFPEGFELPLKITPLTIKTPYSETHKGINIIAPNDTEVFAVSSGEVIIIDNSTSKDGKYIQIKHEGGVYTLYGNLKDIEVEVGDKVEKGQLIGKSNGDSIHLELSKGELNEDPSWIITGFFNAEEYNMTEEDAQIINQIIAMAKTKVGLPYVWGGKGEVLTNASYNSLVSAYGSNRYPLGSSTYIGKQAFDCSGFTHWLYMQTTGVSIGGNTSAQEALLKNYKVDMGELQPGDIVFSNGHVALYIGNSKIIHASNSKAYPNGGIKEDNLYDALNRAYRPIAYINQ